VEEKEEKKNGQWGVRVGSPSNTPQPQQQHFIFLFSSH
jgi:hypothetical protein